MYKGSGILLNKLEGVFIANKIVNDCCWQQPWHYQVEWRLFFCKWKQSINIQRHLLLIMDNIAGKNIKFYDLNPKILKLIK